MISFYSILWRFVLFFIFPFTTVFSQDRPNIVVILVDDAGNKDWGFQGSDIAISPNIDTLASEGTIFTQGYVTNSVCAPSRAGMLSGQYQNKYGFEYNIVKYSTPPNHEDADVGIDPSIPTMGNYLQELGYATSLFGKWHLGEHDHHRPNNRGFDHFYGLLGGSRNYNIREESFDKQLRRNGEIVEPLDDNFYLTDLLTDEALGYMTTQLDLGVPFLAFMSYTAPHGPYQAKAADKALFDNITELNEDQKHYYGMIKNVDDNVKRIIDLLKDRNAYDNTMFVFLSDNGGTKKAANNGGLRGFKSSQYEGGLRVPFFATWKNGISSGNTYTDQVISLDLTTTFIKAAGGDLSDDRYFELDGKDLVSVANNGNIAHDVLYWRKKDKWSVVSDGNNKVIINNEIDDNNNIIIDTLLYDLDLDISETTDRYATNRSNVQHLLASYDSWDKTLDLPSWIGTEYQLPKICGDIPEAKNCQVVIDEYAAFALATELTEISREELHVLKSGTAVLDISVLEYTDSIKSPAVITYILDALPQQGNLMNAGVVMQVGDHFHQLDINRGRITYQHTGNDISSDSFSFSVNDGSGHEDYQDVSLTINILDSNGVTYYFSSSSGDDNNTGLSANSAFASIDKLNSLDLNPGDTVLFSRGDTFIGQVLCRDSGIDGAPIVYDAYGSGDLPIISGSTGNDGIPDPLSTFQIIDQSYLEFKNLHIQNERFDELEGVDNDKSFGIFYTTEQLGSYTAGRNRSLPEGYTGKEFEEAIQSVNTLRFNEHLYFSNLHFDKIYSLGIDGIDFNSVRTTAIYLEEAMARDVIIEDSYFTDMQRTGIWLRRFIADAIIRNNTFIGIGGSGAILSNVKRVLYESNYMQFCGANLDPRMAARGSGMWTFSCDGVVAQYNISQHARGDGDSSGMHVDWGNKNILYQYNYSEDSAGGFCETLGDNDNVIWRYNISVNDGDSERGGKNRLLWFSEYSARSARSRDVYVYNNTIYAGLDYNNEDTDSEVFLQVEQLKFYNNIISLEEHSKLGVGIDKFRNETNSTDFKKNIFYGGQIITSLLELDDTRIEADPMFIKPGTHNELGYRLLEGSPAFGSSITFDEPLFPYAGEGIFKDVTARATKDFYGNPVNLQESTNIGAYNGEPTAVEFIDTYEAENSDNNSGRIISCENSSGENVVNTNASGSSVVFNVSVPETKDYLISMFYVNPTVDAVDVTINGEKENIWFQFTDGYCYQNGTPSNYQIVRRLNSGENTIELSSSIFDKIEVVSFENLSPVTSGEWEAENAELTGKATINSCSNFSEGAAVKGLKQGSSNAVVFNNVDVSRSGQYDLIVSYNSTKSTTMNIEVNGVVQVITVPSTGKWCYQGGNPGDFITQINLNAGSNVIKIYNSPVLDKIRIELGGTTKRSGVGESTWTVFPNPVIKGQDIQIVNFKNESEIFNQEKSTYSLIDVSGKEIFKSIVDKSKRIVISTINIERGLYFLKVNIADKSIVKRILIK